MCNCGCNTCETKGPLLTEGKVKSLLSEGLQYHIDKKIPLFETVYRIGSKKHLSLIKEARKMYSRNVIDLCEEDEALIKTHLGEFALYEGVSIPLDLPMLEEEVNNSDLDNAIYRLENVYKYLDTEYKETRRGEKFIQINYIPVTSPQSQNPEFVNVRYNNDEDIEMIKNRLGLSVLNESYDYDEVAQSEFGMDYDQLGSGEKEWVRDEIDNMSMNESDSNYPDFDLNKNIRYQDTSISSGMWRYTGKEQGGKGVYRNLNNGQILGFSKDDFDIFRKHLSSHFDISESLDEAKKKKAKKKDNRPIGKPMRDTSGGKAYKVYVKDPKTKKVKTVRFGSGGLRAKINDSKARAAFAARHKCSQKKDRTKAGYWSCRLPRYAKLLGLKSSFSGFW